ncbi:hypothetical protein VOLCADRAFT_91442 [Volvox carteri f. nagariensis]|uniref:Vps41 beta-propeller domain-containing protein n=1 Tax=Volvox carteri f. nagariensis TaxID=3068 RepID=D8TX34_VOLCA|nr:uncharacterized protein VOLCADRAFT_91442 [Volvox carteri f. nagariensis]EFJ47941.1 hypothetical protein VOLCADRAFT_91442 [Volvox carteri f. nagariensis]|eukprot:XP_002951047.1 hypothetical protein VOLCADRAFT_91442 [Volvox carteri f. nagariensis]
MTVSEKILAIGTEQGRVHILDYSGNQVRLLNLHKARVNDLSFDKEAEHIASASNDCTVVITNLYTEQTTRHEFQTPIKVVALDPRPAASSRKTWRDLVTGTAGGEVTLHTQGWLSRADQHLAAAASRDVAAGGVLALKWSGTLVAWVYDSAVTVYDTSAHQSIRTLRRYDPRGGLPSSSSSCAAAVAAAAAAGQYSPSPSPPQQQQHLKPTSSTLSGAAPTTTATTTATATTAAKATSVASGAVAAVAAGGSTSSSSSTSQLRRCSLLFAPDSHLYVAWTDTVLVARIWSYENNTGSASPAVELVARMRLEGETVLGRAALNHIIKMILRFPSRRNSTQV